MYILRNVIKEINVYGHPGTHYDENESCSEFHNFQIGIVEC